MRRLHDDNDFGDASLCLRRQQSIDCERSTLSARPSRTEGHHLDGRRQALIPSADLVAVLIVQASEMLFDIHTTQCTYRTDLSPDAGSRESKVYTCEFKPAWPCLVREGFGLHSARRPVCGLSNSCWVPV